jgi:DNA-binding beta-propeller fold protein YncE
MAKTALSRLAGTTSRSVVAISSVVDAQLSPDGKQFWITGRYHGEVAVIDTTIGESIRSIRTDPGPHGLTYFPTSKAAHSVGHNGIYVED